MYLDQSDVVIYTKVVPHVPIQAQIGIDALKALSYDLEIGD